MSKLCAWIFFLQLKPCVPNLETDVPQEEMCGAPILKAIQTSYKVIVPIFLNPIEGFKGYRVYIEVP